MSPSAGAGPWVVAFGVLIAVWGIMLDPTTTTTVTSCTPHPFSHGQICADAVGTRDNIWRPITILTGIIVGVVGLQMMGSGEN